MYDLIRFNDYEKSHETGRPRQKLIIFERMNYLSSTLILLFFLVPVLSAQEIRLTSTGSLSQAEQVAVESETLLPFDEIGIESGYVLYRTEIEITAGPSVLELENVRDYAAVYLDNRFQGTLTDARKKLTLPVPPGKYTLRLYAENIGRITYGPEILDNCKGLFGTAALDGAPLGNWTVIPLDIKECDIEKLTFGENSSDSLPAFHKGRFELTRPEDTYLDVSGWGMGEVWINGCYLGSYWEEEKQQSIPVDAGNLQQGTNEIVVFDLKSNGRKIMRLTSAPVFK